MRNKLEGGEVTSPKRLRRFELKKHDLTQGIARMKTQLKRLKLEQCDFCNHRTQCRAMNRKKKHLNKRLRKAETELNFLSSYLIKEFEGKCKVLTEMEYLGEENTFRIGAEIIRRVHIEELLVSEMILEGLFDRLSPEDIGALLLCIGRDPDRMKTKSSALGKSLKREVEELADYLRDMEERNLTDPESGKVNWNFADAGYLWASGESLASVVEKCEIYEGDLISALRQAVDLAKQIKRVYVEVPGFTEQKGLKNVTETLYRLERPILREFYL